MSTTYKAVEVTRPGVFNLTERPLNEPPAGQVRIRIEACGVCHSDSATVDGLLPGLTFPRVPGHEVVGRIDALGQGVFDWKIGQRIGVGFSVDTVGNANRADAVILLIAQISPSPALISTAATLKS